MRIFLMNWGGNFLMVAGGYALADKEYLLLILCCVVAGFLHGVELRLRLDRGR